MKDMACASADICSFALFCTFTINVQNDVLNLYAAVLWVQFATTCIYLAISYSDSENARYYRAMDFGSVSKHTIARCKEAYKLGTVFHRKG